MSYAATPPRSSVDALLRAGTADQADLVKLRAGKLNLMSLHSTLLWQLPIIEHKVARGNGNIHRTSRMMMMVMT